MADSEYEHGAKLDAVVSLLRPSFCQVGGRTPDPTLLLTRAISQAQPIAELSICTEEGSAAVMVLLSALLYLMPGPVNMACPDCWSSHQHRLLIGGGLT